MVKRLIALAAAILMLIGSSSIPQASNGEPVRQEEQHDRTASVISESSSGNSGPEEAPESADESARRIIDSDRLPDRRVAEHTEESKGVEVDGGEIFRVVAEIYEGEDSGSPEEDGTEPSGPDSGPDSAPADEAEPEPEGYSEDAAADSWEAEVEPEPVVEEPQMEYLGDWTATGYCPAECCCGSWAWGATASGVMPTANHTVACNSLPFGTQLMIDGIVYTVEDTGWSPYGDAWVDIFFDTHSEALAWGERIVSVYLVR